MIEIGQPTTTTWFIIATALVWFLYDIYLYLKKKPTISRVFTEASWYSPMVPFILGLLMGHWFW